MLLATLLLGSLSWLQALGQGYHVAAYVPQYPPQPPFPLGGNAPYPQPGGYPQGPQIYPGPFEPDIPRAPAQYVWGGPGPVYQKPPSWYPQQQPPPGYNQLQYVPPRPPPTRPPAPPQLPPSSPKPSEIMADCVNLLAVRVLFDHASARGNFVFSPYGATSVLCVLWEGSTGATSRQLQQALILPPEPDTVRVGMRDLHRHLKSYFGHNGYLQGVELSRDKETSLRADFIPVLRIYGYHMEETKPEEDATTTMSPDSAMQGSDNQGASTHSPEVDLEEVTVLPEDSPNTEVTSTMSSSTESSVDPMQPTHTPESMNSTTQSSKPESMSSESMSSTTESMSNKPESMSSTSESTTFMSESSKPADSMSSTTESMSNKPESMSSTTESMSNKPESMSSTTESMSDKTESMTTDSTLASKPESTSESTLASESSKPESMSTTTESDKPESMALVSSTESPSTESTTLTTMHSEVTTMHSDMSTGAASEALTVTSMPDDETQTQGSTTLQSDEATPPAEENEDEEGARRKRESNDKNVLFPDIALTSGRENMTEQTEDVDSDPLAPRRSFRLFSGTFTRPVPVMERRGELLPFASLPGLRSIAAMLPLDDPRYGLLVLLPTDGRGPALKQLAAELTQVPLRKVLAALRISRLHVTLPKFAARGPVVLTSSLQQLGIWDVFDPRLARFDRMSTDPGLFVRELEQTVRIDFGTARSINTRVITARSVPEVVDLMRPFLYFVVDRETQTALLAGKVEDPSTPRIF